MNQILTCLTVIFAGLALSIFIHGKEAFLPIAVGLGVTILFGLALVLISIAWSYAGFPIQG